VFAERYLYPGFSLVGTVLGDVVLTLDTVDGADIGTPFSIAAKQNASYARPGPNCWASDSADVECGNPR
jgi:hypothetical protein